MSLIQESVAKFTQGPSSQSIGQAIQLLQQAVMLAERGKAPTPEVVALYWISHFYRQEGAADSALSYGRQILRVARSHRVAGGEATGLFALAQVYADIQRVDSLFQLTNDAAGFCRDEGGCWFDHQLIALVAPFIPADRDSLIAGLHAQASAAQVRRDTVGLARLYDAMGEIFEERFFQFDSALAYHRKAVALNQPDENTIYGIGRAFRWLGEPDSAWAYLTLLLKAARQLGNLRAEGYALANLAAVCQRDMRPPRLGCSLAYYDSAASVASQVLREAGQDLNRVVYGEQASQIYAEWPFAWLSAADSIGKPAATLSALAATELGRSEALRDLMIHVRTRERLPPLGSNADWLGQQIVSRLPAGTATLSYLVNPYFINQQSQGDTILAWLTLPTKEVRLYRWAIRYDSLANEVSSLRSSLGADDAAAGTRLRGVTRGAPSVEARDAQRLATTARHLAAVLIPRDLADLLPQGTDLVLVPQNVLNLIPFTILPLPGGTTLGARYPIRYAPSLAALINLVAAEAAVPPARSTEHHALVISNPVMPVANIDGENWRLSQLPGADSEGAWVAARLKARWVSGSQATEAQVLRDMRDADIVHFATHAVAFAYYSRVRDSFLALAPDSTHDGLLTVGKLMDDSSLSIPARLVVLSGCQTALGSVMQAEGTVGLQRAFLAKGAHAVLVSLWSVDDEATETLMKRFYNHWLGDSDTPTKAEALRRAQQDVRKTARFASPLYWAAFELVGAN